MSVTNESNTSMIAYLNKTNILTSAAFNDTMRLFIKVVQTHDKMNED